MGATVGTWPTITSPLVPSMGLPNVIHLQHSDPLPDGSMPQTALPQIAPTGARDIAVSADGLRIYIAAPNAFDDTSPGAPSFQLQDGNLIEVTLNPSTDNSVPTVASIVAIPASKATYGVATDPANSNEVVFTNGQTDDFGVEVVDDANGQKQNVPLNLNQGSTSGLSVHSANGIAVYTYTNPQTGAQETYAFVAGRADIVNNTFFTDQDDDPLYEGGDVGIIKDPFGPNPELIAATRPIADSFPTDLALSADGQYLYVSYQGLGVANASGGISNGALLVFNAAEIVKQIENPANAPYLSRVAIDDLPLNQSNQRSVNTAIDVQAAYGLDPTNLFADIFKVLDPAHGPIGIGGYPGGIAVQKGAIPTPSVLMPAASGGGSPTTPGYVETDQFEIDTEVDPMNGEVDPGSTEFAFTLGVTSPASVSLTIDGKYLKNVTITDAQGDQHKFASSQNMALDAVNQNDVFKLTLGVSGDTDNPLNKPGTHPFILSLVTGDGRTAERSGEIITDVVEYEAAPVAHTFVDGVDISDGHLVVSGQDVSIPGIGLLAPILAHLFQRRQFRGRPARRRLDRQLQHVPRKAVRQRNHGGRRRRQRRRLLRPAARCHARRHVRAQRFESPLLHGKSGLPRRAGPGRSERGGIRPLYQGRT